MSVAALASFSADDADARIAAHSEAVVTTTLGGGARTGPAHPTTPAKIPMAKWTLLRTLRARA